VNIAIVAILIFGVFTIVVGLWILFSLLKSVLNSRSLEEIWNLLSGAEPWDNQITRNCSQDSSDNLFEFVIAIAIVGALSLFYVKSLSMSYAREFYAGLGIKLKKIARTAQEIDRKTFHLTGLGVPILYQYLVKFKNWSRQDFSQFCMIVTLIIWTFDVIRLLFPSLMCYYPYSILSKIIREKERTQLSGTCYFSLGCTIAITCFPLHISILSIIWLIIGDMSAAIIGVSFGGETVSLKLGREGKKSVEGSLAMFAICVLSGIPAFSHIYLGEYAVVIGALTATLVELYEPFGLNDNITIPVISSISLQLALLRIQNCSNNN
jgi:dolichol kinase